MVVPTEALPVPEWAVWRAFHDALAFYRQQSQIAVEQMLVQRLTLTEAQSKALLVAGAAYLGAIQAIDRDAGAEFDAKYGRNRATPDGSSVGGMSRVPPRAILAPAGKTLYDLARESGLYDLVERRKEEALHAHLAQVEAFVGAERRARLAAFVRMSVAPSLRRGAARPAVKADPRSKTISDPSAQ